MERMFSPWRAQHIEQMADGTAPAAQNGEASLFTRLLLENRDAHNLILWRGPLTFVVLNRYPYNNGHLMVVPYREVAAYEDLTPDEQAAIAHTTARCITWLNAVMQPEGFNVGLNLGAAAGAGIPRHIHQHIVPRWAGDTNFMPVLGEVKVIPEALHDTYRKLRAAIEAEPG